MNKDNIDQGRSPTDIEVLAEKALNSDLSPKRLGHQTDTPTPNVERETTEALSFTGRIQIGFDFSLRNTPNFNMPSFVELLKRLFSGKL